MLKAELRYKEFIYRRPATTSRGTYTQKNVWFILLFDDDHPQIKGIGECSLFPGLSIDDREDFEPTLKEVVDSINRGAFDFSTPLLEFPSIQFALETAQKDLQANGTKLLFPSAFTRGEDFIRINGLIWMGDRRDMENQIDQKLSQGFSCVKMKIGAIGFEDEFEVLTQLRKRYPASDLEIRLDANGAFAPAEAPEKLKRLSDLTVHSIEQPIRQKQTEEMAKLCAETPIPIALDEELLGVFPINKKEQLLDEIRPQYIILKPGLLGGTQSCEEWIKAADQQNVGWWITSALETNIGLNVVAQWTYTLKKDISHGLSTGSLFENNIESPLNLQGERLYYSPEQHWRLEGLKE
ncbi:MAG: o-succinylbenzoate synthase [Draconibacterium sp.]